MGAGCTISSNKNFLSMQVLSPQKKANMKAHDQSRTSNKMDQSEMVMPNNQPLIDEQDFSPKFEENHLKKLQIGKFLTPNNNHPTKSYWKVYLNGVNTANEVLFRLRDLYKNNPKFFSSNLEKFGAPENFRWESWYLICGDGYPSSVLEEKNFVNRLFYETISSKDCKSEEDIKKDIFRTFPKHPYFSEIEQKTEGDQINTLEVMSKEMGNIRLYRLLKAIANQYPHIGYCQGMNFIFGFILAVSGGKECQTFQLVMKLAEAPKFRIMGFYENGFPLMKLYCFIFYKILDKKNKKLAKHLKDVDLPDSIWLTKWVLTMLIYSFPFELSLRLWDFIIGSENLFNLIKICLELLRCFEKSIMQKDAMEIADFLREISDNKDMLNDKKSASYIDPELVIKKARKIKLTEKMIGKFTKEFIASLERDEEKQNENFLFYQEFGKNTSVKKNKKKVGKGKNKDL